MTTAHRTPAPSWPDRRIVTRKAPSVGDVVELGTTRYRVTALHQTDDGPLARLVPTGGATFVMARELAWQAGGYWAPETEGEARESWGK